MRLAEGDLEKLSFAQLADSVTVKPKAELLHFFAIFSNINPDIA